MAIDPTPSTLPPDSMTLPVIENEFPTYRAISSTAILSLVFGVAAVFCYAHLGFLLLVALSVTLGLLAIRKIRRFPDILTGAIYAQVGIALALIFGFSSVTRVLSEDLLINIDAGGFAKRYVVVLKDETVERAIWYEQGPEFRNQKSPEEMAEEMKKSRSPVSGDAFREKSAPIEAIKQRIKGLGGSLSYDSIESRAVDGLTTYANALLKVEGPEPAGDKEHSEGEHHALLQMTKGPNGGPLDWVILDVKYPYTPMSAVATVQKKADDDGHGHAH